MFRKTFFIIAVCHLAFFSTAIYAQQSNQTARGDAVEVKKVRGNLYQATGGVGNAYFYVGPNETLVIDAKMSKQAAEAMLAEIKKITDKPVRRVVLTHSDGDHVGGLSGFPADVTIISHANVRKDIDQANGNARAKLPLPSEIFSKEMTIFVGDTEIQLLYFGPAHTSGDSVVYIPSEKAAIVGDLVFVDRDPLIHAQKNGSSFGLVSVLKSLLQLDADLYLSGHADGVSKKNRRKAARHHRREAGENSGVDGRRKNARRNKKSPRRKRLIARPLAEPHRDHLPGVDEEKISDHLLYHLVCRDTKNWSESAASTTMSSGLQSK